MITDGKRIFLNADDVKRWQEQAYLRNVELHIRAMQVGLKPKEHAEVNKYIDVLVEETLRKNHTLPPP